MARIASMSPWSEYPTLFSVRISNPIGFSLVRSRWIMHSRLLEADGGSSSPYIA
jgi:hypothetical protein